MCMHIRIRRNAFTGACSYVRYHLVNYMLYVHLTILLLQHKSTPLHRAAEKGHLKIVEILLSEGAELDSRDIVSACNNVMSLVYRTS